MAQSSNIVWYKNLLTPQTFIYLMGAVVATVIFWYRTQESWAKGKEIENMINRQWQIQRDMNDVIEKKVQEIRDWMRYQEGYLQGKKDSNNN